MMAHMHIVNTPAFCLVPPELCWDNLLTNDVLQVFGLHVFGLHVFG